MGRRDISSRIGGGNGKDLESLLQRSTTRRQVNFSLNTYNANRSIYIEYVEQIDNCTTSKRWTATFETKEWAVSVEICHKILDHEGTQVVLLAKSDSPHKRGQ